MYMYSCVGIIIKIIILDDVRNDIYVTLEHGQFEKGNKTAPRNVEVAIAICGSGGKIIPVSEHVVVVIGGVSLLLP